MWKTFPRTSTFIRNALSHHLHLHTRPQTCCPEAPRTPTESCGNSYFPFLRNVVTNVQTSFANQLTDFCEVDNRMCRSDSSSIAASHDPETVFEESNTLSVSRCRLKKKSRSCPQAGKTEKRGWRGGGLQQEKKGRDKDMQGKIIRRTCRNLTLAFPAEMIPVLMEVLQLGKVSTDLHAWAEQLLGRLLHKHLTGVRKTSSETIGLRHGWKHAINYKNARLICISWTMHQDVFLPRETASYT